jgi:hypothetical protein
MEGDTDAIASLGWDTDTDAIASLTLTQRRSSDTDTDAMASLGWEYQAAAGQCTATCWRP